jgi:TolA-binding protein
VAGRFAIILQQAKQRGLEPSLAEVSSDDLAALADAARYSRLDDVARRALLAQRRRFPQSARANDAAFLLGRLEETAQHPEIALAWYDRCLTEAPNGTYTSEALGRKMTVVQRLYGAARARPMADVYLRRFGNGTYAAAARALTRAP